MVSLGWAIGAGRWWIAHVINHSSRWVIKKGFHHNVTICPDYKSFLDSSNLQTCTHTSSCRHMQSTFLKWASYTAFGLRMALLIYFVNGFLGTKQTSNKMILSMVFSRPNKLPIH
jgi:hypothetical protein